MRLALAESRAGIMIKIIANANYDGKGINGCRKLGLWFKVSERRPPPAWLLRQWHVILFSFVTLLEEHPPPTGQFKRWPGFSGLSPVLAQPSPAPW